MAKEANSLYRFGGLAFMAGSALFLLKACLDLLAGAPPASGAAILAWVAANELALALVSEVLFFAAMSLVPAVAALYQSLRDIDRPKAVAGCGVLALVIPLLAMLLIVHGRLIYPVYGLRIADPAAAELALGIYYGGMHAVSLLLAFATLVLSLAMLRGGYGKRIAYLGIVSAMLDVVGAYPYAIGPGPTFICQLLLSSWFAALGVKLYRMG